MAILHLDCPRFLLKLAIDCPRFLLKLATAGDNAKQNKQHNLRTQQIIDQPGHLKSIQRLYWLMIKRWIFRYFSLSHHSMLISLECFPVTIFCIIKEASTQAKYFCVLITAEYMQIFDQYF